LTLSLIGPEGYVKDRIAAFKAAGFTKVFFADARLYHDSSGSLHCGTNVIRALPPGKWWEA